MGKHSKGKHAAHAQREGAKSDSVTPAHSSKPKREEDSPSSEDSLKRSEPASSANEDSKKSESASSAKEIAKKAEEPRSQAKDAKGTPSAKAAESPKTADSGNAGKLEGSSKDPKADAGPQIAEAAQDEPSKMELRIGAHQNPVSTRKERRQQKKLEKQAAREAKKAQIAAAKASGTHKSKKKVFAIVTASFACALSAIYLIGVAAFSFVLMPNTTSADVDLSWQTPESVQEMLESRISQSKFRVTGQGLDFTISSKDAGLALDADAATERMMADQDPWQWPIQVFARHDASEALSNALSATQLANVVTSKVEELNATAQDPQSAYVMYSDSRGSYVVMPEVPGTKLDASSVLEEIAMAVIKLEPKVALDSKVKVAPAVLESDERLIAQRDKANALASPKVQVNMEGINVANIDQEALVQWIALTPEYDALVDSQAVIVWAEALADSLNTIGSTRSYVRPDGKEITVSGGSYGWEVDSEELANQIAAMVNSGANGVIDVPVLQAGNGFSAVGSKDWGSRYIDVDISEQHARFYDGDQIIWEAPIVSGKRGISDTPQGVWKLNSKGRNVTLTGRMTESGEPEYETPVSYWMPFKGNSVGLHDANWQSSFGGSRYAIGAGSHGCVNLPPSSAAALYDIISVGDVVVVHG